MILYSVAATSDSTLYGVVIPVFLYSLKEELYKILYFLTMVALSPVPESAYTTVPSRKSDVYSYGVVLLELITRKKVLLEDREQVTTLVSWARSMWVETAKVEKIVDSDLASKFPNSAALEWQVTEVLLLALRCTDRDPRKRPTMRHVVGIYQQDRFKLSCEDAEAAGDVAPKPYNVPVVSDNPNLPILQGGVRESVKKPFCSFWINLIKSKFSKIEFESEARIFYVQM